MLPLLAQIEPSQLVLGAKIAGVVYLATKGVELYSNFNETKDRRITREHIVQQTEILRGIAVSQHESAKVSSENNVKMGVALDRQDKSVKTIDHIDKGVTQLKTLAGIPDTI